MSYSCTISFKQIPASDVFDFLGAFKKAAYEKLEDIAKENSSFSPIMRECPIGKEFTISDEIREKTRIWAQASVFHYRHFYNKELGILGVYGVPDCIQDIFDLTVYFQNSCDQDYNFEEWNGIPLFEEIAAKWKSRSLEEIAKLIDRESDIDDMRDLEKTEPQYYAKSACYEEIWSHFENTLYDDSAALYLSLFGFYDIHELNCFVQYTEDAVIAKIKEWTKRIEENKEKKNENN